MIDSLLLAFTFFIATVMAHIAVCHLGSSKKFMLKGLILGVFSIGLLISIQVINKELQLFSVYFLGTMWLLYLMFFINLLNSITLKMLFELEKNGGELPKSGFNQFFSEKEGINSRFEKMQENGFLKKEAGLIELKAKAIIMVSIVKLLRRFFSMK